MENNIDPHSNINKVRKLLQLCFLQSKLAVDSSEDQVNLLSTHFMGLVELEQALCEKISAKQDINQEMAELSQLISSIIIEFQFFDRLKQQITHAVSPLQNWTEKGVLANPYDAKFIQQYSTKEERDIYNLVMKSNLIEDAEVLCD